MLFAENTPFCEKTYEIPDKSRQDTVKVPKMRDFALQIRIRVL